MKTYFNGLSQRSGLTIVLSVVILYTSAAADTETNAK